MYVAWDVEIANGRVVTTVWLNALLTDRFTHPLSDWERAQMKFNLSHEEFRKWRKAVMKLWPIANRMKFLGAS